MTTIFYFPQNELGDRNAQQTSRFFYYEINGSKEAIHLTPGSNEIDDNILNDLNNDLAWQNLLRRRIISYSSNV